MRDLDLTSLRLFVAVCETRNIARAAERVQRARQRDVVDVVAGFLRHRAVLAPAGHAAVDEPGVVGEELVRAGVSRGGLLIPTGWAEP